METHCGLGVMYTMNIEFDTVYTMNIIMVAMNTLTTNTAQYLYYIVV